MTTLVLDAGVWLASVERDEAHHEESAELIRRAAAGDLRVAALDLTLYEVANVAVVSWKSSSAAADLVRLVRVACGGDVDAVDEELCVEAGALALQRGLSVYDAAYVVAAQRRGAQLVSLDVADLVRPGLAVLPGAALDA